MGADRKRGGADWDVTYQDVPTGDVQTMTVFGATTIENALADAHDSLRGPEPGTPVYACSPDGTRKLMGTTLPHNEDDDYEIVAIVRRV